MLKNDKKEGQKEGTEALSPPFKSSIGPSCRVEGDLTGTEDLMIAGQFQGKIQIGENDLIILKTARIQAEIRAKNVTIQGQVTGNVLASGKVLVEETARMTGDITAPCLSVMDGAKFKGSVHMTQEKTLPSQIYKSKKLLT